MNVRSKRIVLTGAGGQLGSAVVQRLESTYHLLPFTHRQLDLTDHHALTAAVTSAAPDVIINCAAYTDVDGAESHAALALDVNAFAVRTLARTAQRLGAVLIHFSTDFVFDGRSSVPYTESDATNPKSTYAMSKLLGEWFAGEVDSHYVLRVESLFGGPAVLSSGRRSSVDRIVDAIEQGRESRVFVDRTVSPSYVLDVAQAVGSLIDRQPRPGVYHCVNSGCCTWHELALEVQRLLGRPAALTAVSADDVKLVAERPKYSALSNRKLADAGIALPAWQDALSRYLTWRRQASA